LFLKKNNALCKVSRSFDYIGEYGELACVDLIVMRAKLNLLKN